MNRFELAGAFLVAGLAAAIAAPAWDAKDGVIFPPEKGRQLLHQCSRGTPQPVSGFWLPQPAQTAQLEKLLPGLLETKLAGQRQPPIKLYKRQYAGVIVQGRRVIYVNGFASSGEPEREGNRWRTEAIIVCDGGNGFFGVEYDPATKAFQGLAFNGVA